MSWKVTVQKPYEGCVGRPCLKHADRSKPSEDRLILWGAEIAATRLSLSQKRARGNQKKFWLRFSREYPGRAKPKGGTSGCRAKHLHSRQVLSEGRTWKPRCDGAVRRCGVGKPLNQSVGRAVPAEDAVETFRKAKPPKG